MQQSQAPPVGPSVGLVTYARLPQGAPDDALLVAALAARGLVARPLVWDDPGVDWAAVPLCVIRSTWDYHLRRAAFLAWATRVAAVTALWNPAPLVRWNTHKSYLRDLAARGVPTVPAVWLPAGTPADLAAILAAQGWESAVVKPAVGADSHGAQVVTPETRAAGQAHLARFLAGQDMLVQPFLDSIDSYGERSLIYIDGVLTHAVRRHPLPRTPGAGPSAAPAPLVPVAAGEAALGTQVLAALDLRPLYARVDLVRDGAGTPRVLELELVEPSLFFAQAPAAATQLAAAITACIPGGA
ncbi:MAG TPA: hypothetical protein VKY74_19260 [Chloroflexia bacterium]|nr:hypothetical protein [Chloroflexia bacterium]